MEWSVWYGSSGQESWNQTAENPLPKGTKMTKVTKEVKNLEKQTAKLIEKIKEILECVICKRLTLKMIFVV